MATAVHHHLLLCLLSHFGLCLIYDIIGEIEGGTARQAIEYVDGGQPVLWMRLPPLRKPGSVDGWCAAIRRLHDFPGCDGKRHELVRVVISAALQDILHHFGRGRHLPGPKTHFAEDVEVEVLQIDGSYGLGV